MEIKRQKLPYCPEINKNIKAPQYYFLGSKLLLKNSPVAIFCSREIPLSIYHIANETFTKMLKLPLTIAGGWQSAMEKRVLKNLTSGSQANIIYFFAKGINYFRTPKHLAPMIDSLRLLIISPFSDKPRRMEKRFVEIRDDLILSLISRFFFLHIKPDGYLETVFRNCIDKGKEVFLLEHQVNSRYFIKGTKSLNLKNLKERLLG